MTRLKAMVVDDSILYRKVLSDILSEFPEVELAGTASNGKIAVEKLERQPVDFITLDFEMPEMDGLEVLKRLKTVAPDVKAVMVSSHTRAGATVTMNALEQGAFDFIDKPDTGSVMESKQALKSQLRAILNVLLVKQSLRGTPPPKPVAPLASRPSQPSPSSFASGIAQRMRAVGAARPDIVAIGVSTGGPNALSQVIPSLPGSLRVPVVIVQHMPPMFTAALAESLGRKSALRVCEATDGEKVLAGSVYIAPGGRQMRLERSPRGELVIRITDDAPENNCKPSVDYLFRSVSKLFGASALGVIMTGMGSDGVKGLAVMKEAGAKVIAQDEATCVVYGMPMEAVKAGVVDTVLPLSRIADEIVSCVRY